MVLERVVVPGIHLRHARLEVRLQSRPGKTRLASIAVCILCADPQVELVHIAVSLDASDLASCLVVDESSIRLEENVIALVCHLRAAHQRAIHITYLKAGLSLVALVGDNPQ